MNVDKQANFINNPNRFHEIPQISEASSVANHNLFADRPINIVKVPHDSHPSKLGICERFRRMHASFGTPVVSIVQLAASTIDSTGLSGVAVKALNEGFVFSGKNRNISIHDKWTKQIASSEHIPVDLSIDDPELIKQFKLKIKEIVEGSKGDIEKIKVELNKTGISTEDITSIESLKKTDKERFKRLLKEFKFHQETTTRASARLERQRARFEELVHHLMINDNLPLEMARLAAQKIEEESKIYQSIHTALTDMIVKMQKLHKKFLKLKRLPSASNTSAALTCGVACSAIKIACIGGLVSGPLGFLISTPFIATPVAVKSGVGIFNFGISAYYRPEITKEMFRWTNLKLAGNQIQGSFQKFFSYYSIKKKEAQNKKLEKLEANLEDPSVDEKKKSVFETEILKAQEKIDLLQESIKSREINMQILDKKILELQTLLINAGWRDACKYLNIQSKYADLLSHWLWEEYQNQRLGPSTKDFFMDQMDVDIDAICKIYPGREAEALSFNIINFFAKDDEKMMELIKSKTL